MRKPRDYATELKALEDKARDLKTRKIQQLGELVIATGADALNVDELTGALLGLVETADTGQRKEWTARGAAFFRGGRTWRSANAVAANASGDAAADSDAQSPSGSASA